MLALPSQLHLIMNRREMKRIALIEDNYYFSKNLEHLLVLNNYTIDIYRTMQRAEVLMLDHKPDLIICDINLPDGIGNSIIQKIRKNKFYHFTPIIVLTGTIDVNINELFDLGVSKVFFKPTRFEILNSAITRLLTRKNGYEITDFFYKPFHKIFDILKLK